MNTKRLLALVFGLQISLTSFGFRVVQYNIKELDSVKLREAKPSEQLQAALAIIKELKPQLLSLNEMQYDSAGVPDKTYTTNGENAALVAKLLGEKYNVSFNPANTGKNAHTKTDGTYSTNPNDPNWMKLVDHVNFGIFPFQYSTAALTKFPIVSEKVIADIRWDAFVPDLDLEPYRDAAGNKFPIEMELFDKNFTDIILKSGKRKFHVILLHTVPAFNFGNDRGLNIVRNADQIRFLEWYLTGKSAKQEAAEIGGIRPLAKGTPFIALGDWNTDIKDKNNPGSEVLRRLGETFSYWHAPSPTYEGGFGPEPFTVQFDYILHSDHFEVRNGGVHFPDSRRKELGCKTVTEDTPEGFVKVSYKKDGEDCFAFVSEAYYEAKVGSDHFPIWADIEFKK
ncbi:MAG: endonuclease/exonuclease/phosphatase family protein [Bdellovibrionaceae bacterium]|nr:endonuclease/exonuclease/phosphatase family protein [Bdellovibrionales bacterium]MCB9253512.1 endonuclease/exonuclease/phosphatase family protein [Pseudobdellovibrionaceae bacterium]